MMESPPNRLAGGSCEAGGEGFEAVFSELEAMAETE